jgi:predicted DNA-binding transcriptional regulator YafY
MYTVPPKKMLTLNILDILRRYSDGDHRLSQRQIVELLESEHQMQVDRKSVKRNLMNLIDCGYEIEYTETERHGKDGETETICGDWYIHHDFEDSELRLLIDSLLFSHQIPSSHCRQLIDKLKGLSNRYFNTRVRHVHSLPEVKSTNRQLFFTIELLDEAISKEKQVLFRYGNYDIDGELHPRLDSEGTAREYRIDPYQMVATNGRYYLICRKDPYDELVYYRVDRILDIGILDSPVKPLRKLPGLADGLDLPKHMAEHVYMFAGNSVGVRFRVRRTDLIHVFDWFGSDVRLENSTDTDVEVALRVNEQAMLYWALQFCERIEVLEPQSLRETLRQRGQMIAEKYA